MNPLFLKLLPYLAAIGIAGGALWWHSSKVESFGEVKFKGGQDEIQAKWDKAKAEQMAAHLQKIVANEKVIKQYEGEKHADTETINGLLGDVAAYRVRLHKATRSGSVSNSPPTSGSPLQACTSGDVLTEAEAILGRDRQRTAGIMGEAEHDLSSRAVVVKWADKLE